MKKLFLCLMTSCLVFFTFQQTYGQSVVGGGEVRIVFPKDINVVPAPSKESKKQDKKPASPKKKLPSTDQKEKPKKLPDTKASKKGTLAKLGEVNHFTWMSIGLLLVNLSLLLLLFRRKKMKDKEQLSGA